jgi:hypothetical protein
MSPVLHFFEFEEMMGSGEAPYEIFVLIYNISIFTIFL